MATKVGHELNVVQATTTK